jgi:hypothetical protein
MRLDVDVNYRGPNVPAMPSANRFAMLRDRFGASWMLLHRPQSA